MSGGMVLENRQFGSNLIDVKLQKIPGFLLIVGGGRSA
jgi:hypothetical protein